MNTLNEGAMNALREGAMNALSEGLGAELPDILQWRVQLTTRVDL